MPARVVSRCLVVTSVTLLLLTLTPRRSAAEVRKVDTIEGISEFRFDNGLQLLLFPDQSRPTVTVNLTLFVGSRHEGYGESGMAHLLEHMLFKGTPQHPSIPKTLQERGARFNGTTWLDRTNYYETLPATDENLEFAIRLEADRMVNSYIRGADLKAEMTVVRNEFEQGENSPSRILNQRMTAVAYEWHNYGKSTIGNRSDIERVPLPKLRAFYRRFYQPDNAMVVIAGKFNEEKALESVQKYFGAIARPSRDLDRTYTEEPAQDGERTVVLRRVGDSQMVGIAYHVPSGAHPEYAAVDVLSYILATEPAGRLYKALVESKKASSIFGGSYALHDPGIIQMMVEMRKGDSPEIVRDIMIDEMEKIGSEGVSPEEVERVRQQILSRRELLLNDSGRIAVELSEWAAQGDWRLFFLYRDRIEKVTADDVQKVAAKYLRRSNRTVGMFIPTDEPERVGIPSTPSVAEMVKDYKGREAVAAGEEFDASPTNIERRTTRFELPSGLKVALLAKKTRGEAVQLQLVLRCGTAETLEGQNAALELLPTLMTRGTRNLTYQQVQDTLDKNRATLSGRGGTAVEGRVGETTFSLATKRPNLPAALDVLQQVLREPALPPEEFDVLRREKLASLEQAKSDPQSLASRLLLQTGLPYSKTDVRYVPSIDEEFDRFSSLNLEQLRKLYEEHLDSRHGELALVGDFDPEEVRGLLQEMFGDWDNGSSYARIQKTAFMDVRAPVQSIETPDKANAVYFARLTLAIKDTDPDYPALVIGNFILGGGTLSSRLGDRVRQKDGLSYGVGSSLSAESQDSFGRLFLYAISNPANSPKVVMAIREELERLLSDGISDEELERAKTGYLESQRVGRTRDQALAGMLTGTLNAKRTMAYYADLEEEIAGLSTDDVVSALRRHVDIDRLVVVTAGDFGKASDAAR